VIVLAETSERAEEIDPQRSRAAHDRAQAELAKAGAGSPEWEHEKLAIERAAVRLEAVGKIGGASQAHS
jgi:F0F1-type ATP synthase epsilon subunit